MIGEWVLFRPLRDNLGLRRIKYAHSGGAPLGADVFRFFAALGVDIKQIYGGTEPSGTISSHRDRVKLESSGQPLPSMEVRISTEGEILVRGDNVFKGYYKDPETTAMSLVNGWFRTGDAGMIDEDGHVICVDRLKDVMTLMDGTKYSPSSMETRLKFSPYIADAVVIGGSDRPYVTALIEIDFENVAKWAEKHSIAYTTFTDLSQKPQVYKLVQEDVQRVNQVVPRIARIRRFGNLYKQLDPDEAELTRTRKLRRGFFEDRYPELVDSLYGDKEEIAIEDTIKYSDGRTGKLRTTFRIQSILEMDNG